MTTMTHDEYRDAHSQALALVRQLQELPLEALSLVLTRALSVGAILGPATFPPGQQNLSDLQRIVVALRAAQATTQQPLADLRRRVAEQLAESGEADMIYWEALAE